MRCAPDYRGGSRNFHKWGPTDCLRGARSSHASVIPYISNQFFFSQKGRTRAPCPPPKYASGLNQTYAQPNQVLSPDEVRFRQIFLYIINDLLTINIQQFKTRKTNYLIYEKKYNHRKKNYNIQQQTTTTR